MGVRKKRAANEKGFLYNRASKGKKIASRRLGKLQQKNPDAGIEIPETAHPDYGGVPFEERMEDSELPPEEQGDLDAIFEEHGLDEEFEEEEDMPGDPGYKEAGIAPPGQQQPANNNAIIIVVVLLVVGFFVMKN